jgi:crossover junction endodeoxyribonuclease RuvC
MESVALMNSWPLEYVRPQAWKKKVLAGTSKDKEAAIAFVRARFPGAPLTLPRCRTPHDGMADAVCIGYYGCLTCSS